MSDAVEDGRAIDSSRTYATDIEPGIRVLGDEAQLQQVVANLLANIRAHTPAGTAAFIRLTHVASKDAETANPANPADAEGREVTVIVSDDGPGISQEQRSRLFERFFRAGSNPAHTGGAGLGLAIVAAIMDEHGGSVSLDDDSATTSFVLRFPSPIDSVDSTSAMMSGHDNR